MTPELVHLPSSTVVGIEVRTTNAAEANPATARIGALWKRFYSEGVAAKVPSPAHPSRVYGVYRDYESDHRGPYTLLVGCPVSKKGEVPQGLVAATIPEADYLVFTAKGPMPKALIETWGVIWRHFGAPGERPRAFTTDFEVHDSKDPERASIHIAVWQAC